MIKIVPPNYIQSRQYKWNDENDYTFLVGYNGSGKTTLIKGLMKWCDSKGYSYNYHAGLSERFRLPEIIDNVSDLDLQWIAKSISDWSFDFSKDLESWANHYNVRTNDPQMIRDVFKRSGGGFQSMFMILYNGIKNPGAEYYFVEHPESSIHISNAKFIVDAVLLKRFPMSKIVISTHSPDIIQDWNESYIIKTDSNAEFGDESISDTIFLEDYE